MSLPKPYYQDSAVTLYHGDCREIMPLIEADRLVVSDPPYNIGYKYHGYKDRMSDADYWDLIRSVCAKPCIILHLPEDMFRLGWIPNECVAWVYNGHITGQWRLLAWFGVKPDRSLMRQPYKNPDDPRVRPYVEKYGGASLYDWWQAEQVKNVSEEKTEHPCQIPLSVMKNAIGITPEPALVVDPFCGSGTTLRACKDLGRQAIGVEIDERYCEIAARRMGQEVLALT